MTNTSKAALSTEQIDSQIAEYQATVADLQAQRLEALHREAGNPQVGDQVLFMRQDYVGRVDEYAATILAVHEGAVCDLSVSYIHGPMQVLGVSFEPTGRPGTWHPKGL